MKSVYSLMCAMCVAMLSLVTFSGVAHAEPLISTVTPQDTFCGLEYCNTSDAQEVITIGAGGSGDKKVLLIDEKKVLITTEKSIIEAFGGDALAFGIVDPVEPGYNP